MSVCDFDPRPNFFLVGAAKSGTTSLAKYLDEHPDVFVSKPKEPNYFAFPPDQVPSTTGPADPSTLFDRLLKYSVTSSAAYAQLFQAAGGHTAIGEASVRYLYCGQSAERISAAFPAARILVLLRNPVDRMVSHYHMNVVGQREPLRLSEALAAEDERVAQGWGWDWHYRRLSRYADQLPRYYACFDPEQILIELHDDLLARPRDVLHRVFAHLGVDPQFEPNLASRRMVGSTPKIRWVRNLFREENLLKSVARNVLPRPVRKAASRWVEQRNRMPVPLLSEAERRALSADFAEDKLRLEALLDRELPW